MIAQGEEDMLKVLTLYLEKLEIGLVILKSPYIASEDKGIGFGRDPEV